MSARFSNEFNTKYPYNPVVATLCALGGGGVNPLVERILELFELGASLIKSLFQWEIENGKWKIVFIFPCGACSTLQDKANTTSKIFNTTYYLIYLSSYQLEDNASMEGGWKGSHVQLGVSNASMEGECKK